MIDALTVGALSVAVIFVLILLGFHIGVALAAVSFVGTEPRDRPRGPGRCEARDRSAR